MVPFQHLFSSHNYGKEKGEEKGEEKERRCYLTPGDPEKNRKQEDKQGRTTGRKG